MHVIKHRKAVEHEGGNMNVEIQIGHDQIEGKGEHVVICICARTTTEIQQCADKKKHEERGPEMRGHTNLRIQVSRSIIASARLFKITRNKCKN